MDSREDAHEWASIQQERAERVERAAKVLRQQRQYGTPLGVEAAVRDLERAANWSPWRREP